MNNNKNEPADYDDEIAAAFTPVAAVKTPDLWDRIETGAVVTEIPSAALWRNQPRVLAAAAAIVVIIGGAVALGLSRPGERVDITDDVTTTTSEAPPTTTTSPTTQPTDTNLRNAAWVRVDLETGTLVSNQDQSFAIGEVALGGRVVDRLPDGTIVLATLDGVFVYASEGEVAEEIWSEGATELRRTGNGGLVALTDAGLVNLETGQLESESALAEMRNRIDAPNGFAVEVIPGEYETDSEGFVSRVIRPDALRLLFEGRQDTVWQFGGPAEYVVVLDDFDGRYVLAHRRPVEPALPVSLHVVIDILQGTTESFAAIPGTVSLATPDTSTRPSQYSVGDISLCPTMSPVILLTAPGEMGQAAAAAFDETALAIARCDETWLRRTLVSGAFEQTVWEQLAASLRTVPRQSDGGWSFGEGAPATVSITDGGDIAIAQNAEAFEVRVVKFEDSLVLAGAVGPETARGLRSAAATQVGAGQLQDFSLTTTGAEMDPALREAVEEMIGSGFNRSPMVEVLVTADLVRVISQGNFVTDGELTGPAFEQAGVPVEATLLSIEPTDSERSVIEALQSFAAGNSLDPSIQWADEVIVGAGPIEARRLTPAEVASRSNWLIETVPFFRASGEEAFSALRVVPNPTMIGGPHNHCASPPVPAPASLAGLRRVSIQPESSSFDSCLQWFTFDVFFDADGAAAGVTIDWWEP